MINDTSGYWQLPLSEQSSYLTTPFWRYCFVRMPFGIKSASEVLQRKMEEEFGDVEGVEIIVYDLRLV